MVLDEARRHDEEKRCCLHIACPNFKCSCTTPHLTIEEWEDCGHGKVFDKPGVHPIPRAEFDLS